MLDEHRFFTGDIDINYAVGGSDGPPLVLLHGFMGRWQDWMPLLPFVVADWCVYAPDMRGHGRSGRAPGGIYRHADVAADLVSFLDGVVGEPALVFGHSAGAPAAVEAAGTAPGAVRAVIVGDFPLDFPWLVDLVGTPPFVAYHRAVRAVAGRDVDSAKRVLASLNPETRAAELSAAARSLVGLDPHAVDCHAEGRLGDFYGVLDGDALLRGVTGPLALIQCEPEMGGMMSDDYVHHAMSLLHDGTHLRLDGVGHGMGLDTGTVDGLASALVPYLESV
jgi:pimeloyl-ACP methyl ester carboxylesterase